MVVLVAATPPLPHHFHCFGKVGRPHELGEPIYSYVLLRMGAKGWNNIVSYYDRQTPILDIGVFWNPILIHRVPRTHEVSHLFRSHLGDEKSKLKRARVWVPCLYSSFCVPFIGNRSTYAMIMGCERMFPLW